MAVWDREALYAEVWEEPVSLVARKYGISDVMLAKICRKLAVPVPGRGYWARKAAGQKLSRIPLRKMTDVPVIHRPETRTEAEIASNQKPVFPAPNDPRYSVIHALDTRAIAIESIDSWNRSVTATEKRFSAERTDPNGFLVPNRQGPCLAIHVSSQTFPRALKIMNAVVVLLEREGFQVTVGQGMNETQAKIFGYTVGFQLIERSQRMVLGENVRGGIEERNEVRTPTGSLELRIGDYTHGSRHRDRQREPLESRLAECIAGLLRCGRRMEIAAEQRRQREIEEQRKREERTRLWREIEDEEAKIKQLDGWVNNWSRAEQIRGFILALESTWVASGVDVSDGSEKGKRLQWMREQADRLDPLLESPPSVLDRKNELRYW